MGGGRRRSSDLAMWAELAWSEPAGWAGGAPRWERPESVGTAAVSGLPLYSVAEQSVARLTTDFYRQYLFCLFLDALGILLFIVSVQKFLDGDVWLFCCNYFLFCSLFNSNVTYIKCKCFRSTAPGIFTFVYTCVTPTWSKC